ncbi:MAG: LacI family DNA-binding transcriptional regulator [Fimbriimonadaceae bacterium]
MYQSSKKADSGHGQVTVRDVAARAGVSPTVVSRVLHNKATSIRVSAETAERVRQAARDLGYRVNVMARLFRERQTMVIGVLHGVGFGRPHFSTGSQYFAELMDGVLDSALDHGYSLTFCPKLLGESPEDAMSDGRFDGLVWYSTYPSDENRAVLEQCNVPLVLIHTLASEFKNRFPSVICDNKQGIRLALEHLWQLGHRKIAFALEHDDLFGEAVMRRDAFVELMANHGTPISEGDVIDVGLDRTGLHMYYAAGPRHTAVVGSNDGVAASFLQFAPQYGVSVPQQLSVVGFDSTSYCNQLRPELTSVNQPLVTLGRSAVALLVQVMQGVTLESYQLVFPCSFDVRNSTAPPPIGALI